MGHSSGEDVHSRYTHVELPMKREAIRKLEEWLSTHNSQLNQKGGSRVSTENDGCGFHQVLDPGPGSDSPEAVEKEDPGGSRA
jgi:hypothetical protein